MKKLISSLLIFCSVLLQAQIQIPQVVGLTSALNSKVDKVTGKSLVADTSIVKLTGVQAGAQVNKIDGIQKNGVDLTITGKKVNITVPTTATEIGAQPAGTYATGTGTAYNSNTGDETLTSIKTKLGAASLINSGYLTNTDWSAFYDKQNSLVFGNLTTSTNGVSVTNGAGAIIGAGTAINITTASASSGGLLSTIDWNNFNNKQPSGSYEPSFSKNTAFNKNFGTTTGTVLEGRTFGTAAGSAVGDFINRNGGLTSNLNNEYSSNGTNWWSDTSVGAPVNYGVLLNISDAGQNWNNQLAFGINNNIYFRQSINSSDFGNTVWNNIYHSGNLTKTLTTNYIPKWNGSNFINSLISDVSGKVGISTSARVKLEVNSDLSLPTDLSSEIASGSLLLSDGGNIGTVFGNYDNTGGVFYKGYVQSRLNTAASTPLDFHIEPLGGNTLIGINSTSYYTKILSTTPSTSPTTGALIVGGGIGANHIETNYAEFGNNLGLDNNGLYTKSNGTYRLYTSTNGNIQIGYTADQGYKLAVNGTVSGSSFYGNGSNLTGIQLPITLTTNGTSGAATFSGNVLNVPNYTSSGGVDQTQTTVNGSTSGNIVGSMPFQTGSYKKVIISVNSLNGSATYTFPSSFSMLPRGSSSLSITALSTTSITIAGTGSTGWCTIEGY